MNTDSKTYSGYVKRRSPRSSVAKNTLLAFVTGGLICAFAEALFGLYTAIGIDEKTAGTLVSITLIFIAVLLTGIGVFDNIAKFAGAGTLVPITGFANAVVAPAIDMKNEGYIMGIGAKMFTIAGPVIVFGTLSSAIYGVIYWLVEYVF